MAYRVLISQPASFALVELAGAVRWGDVASALRALHGHPLWVKGDVLWDARGITALDIPPSELPAIQTLLTSATATRPTGRSAVLAKNDVVATLAVLFSHMAPPSGRVMATFDALPDALRFLDRSALPEDLTVLARSAPRAD